MTRLNRQITRSHPVYLTVLIALVILPMAIAIYHDVHRSFVTSPDSDILFPYHAMRLNSGLNSDLTTHPGYTHFVLLAWWMKLTKLFGFNSIASFQDIPVAPSAAFEVAYAKVVYNARYFAAAFAALFSFSVFEGIWIITRNFRAAALVGFIFAASSGLAVNTIMIYTELQSGFFSFVAMLALITATRTWGLHMAIRLGICGFCLILAMLAKVQAIALILGFPILALFFGRRTKDDTAPGCHLSPSLNSVVVVCLCAAILAVPLAAIMVASIIEYEGTGAYQFATFLFVLIAMIIYGKIYSVDSRNAFMAAGSLLLGFSLGFYFVFLYPNIKNIDALVNFVDHLYRFGSVGAVLEGENSKTSWSIILSGVLNGLKTTLVGRFLEPFSSLNPITILSWPLLVSMGIFFLNQKLRNGLTIGFCLVLSILIESVFRLYQFIPKVFIYSDIPILLATALTLSWVAYSFTSRKTWLVIATVLGVVLVNEFKVIIDPMIVSHQPSREACTLAKGYKMKPFVESFSRYCEAGRRGDLRS